MEIIIFKRRLFPGGNYSFSANNYEWQEKERSKYDDINRFNVSVHHKTTIEELISGIRKRLDGIFPNGKHIGFLFSLQGRTKSISAPFDEYTCVTYEELSNDEYEEFLRVFLEKFKDWKG
jgi:hypothetical protein